MEPIFAGILGWLFGLVSALVLDWNKNQRQVKALKISLRFEADALAYRFASVAFNLAAKLGKRDARFANWFLPIETSYEGAEKIAGLSDVLRKLAAGDGQESDGQRISEDAFPGRGIRLRKYSTPALGAAVGQLSEFPAELQQRLLHLQHLIVIFQAVVDDIDEFGRMTFDQSLSQANRAAVDRNRRLAYETAFELAQRITDAAREVADT